MAVRRRILAIEDDEDSYHLLSRILRHLPVEIDHAASGSAAIEYLSREVPDLILLDINLPDMRGWEVLDHFKEDERFCETSVIVLTAYTDPVHRMIGRLQAVTDYLLKPIEPEALRRKVRETLKIY